MITPSVTILAQVEVTLRPPSSAAGLRLSIQAVRLSSLPPTLLGSACLLAMPNPATKEARLQNPMPTSGGPLGESQAKAPGLAARLIPKGQGAPPAKARVLPKLLPGPTAAASRASSAAASQGDRVTFDPGAQYRESMTSGARGRRSGSKSRVTLRSRSQPAIEIPERPADEKMPCTPLSAGVGYNPTLAHLTPNSDLPVVYPNSEPWKYSAVHDHKMEFVMHIGGVGPKARGMPGFVKEYAYTGHTEYIGQKEFLDRYQFRRTTASGSNPHVDPRSQWHFNFRHDGTCGFIGAQQLLILFDENTFDAQGQFNPSEELAVFLEDLLDMVVGMVNEAMYEHAFKKKPVGHRGSACIQGRHRSVVYGKALKHVCKMCGIKCTLMCWDLNWSNVRHLPGCGCGEGNCREQEALRRGPQWARAAEAAWDHVMALLDRAVRAYFPEFILTTGNDCHKWQELIDKYPNLRLGRATPSSLRSGGSDSGPARPVKRGAPAALKAAAQAKPEAKTKAPEVSGGDERQPLEAESAPAASQPAKREPAAQEEEPEESAAPATRAVECIEPPRMDRPLDGSQHNKDDLDVFLKGCRDDPPQGGFPIGELEYDSICFPTDFVFPRGDRMGETLPKSPYLAENGGPIPDANLGWRIGLKLQTSVEDNVAVQDWLRQSVIACEGDAYERIPENSWGALMWCELASRMAAALASQQSDVDLLKGQVERLLPQSKAMFRSLEEFAGVFYDMLSTSDVQESELIKEKKLDIAGAAKTIESLQLEVSHMYSCIDESKVHLERAALPDTSEENRRRVEERVCLPYDGPKEATRPRGEWGLPDAAVPALQEAIEYYELSPSMNELTAVLENHERPPWLDLFPLMPIPARQLVCLLGEYESLMSSLVAEHFVEVAGEARELRSQLLTLIQLPRDIATAKDLKKILTTTRDALVGRVPGLPPDEKSPGRLRDSVLPPHADPQYYSGDNPNMDWGIIVTALDAVSLYKDLEELDKGGSDLMGANEPPFALWYLKGAIGKDLPVFAGHELRHWQYYSSSERHFAEYTRLRITRRIRNEDDQPKTRSVPCMMQTMEEAKYLLDALAETLEFWGQNCLRALVPYVSSDGSREEEHYWVELTFRNGLLGYIVFNTLKFVYTSRTLTSSGRFPLYVVNSAAPEDAFVVPVARANRSTGTVENFVRDVVLCPRSLIHQDPFGPIDDLYTLISMTTGSGSRTPPRVDQEHLAILGFRVLEAMIAFQVAGMSRPHAVWLLAVLFNTRQRVRVKISTLSEADQGRVHYPRDMFRAELAVLLAPLDELDKTLHELGSDEWTFDMITDRKRRRFSLALRAAAWIGWIPDVTPVPLPPPLADPPPDGGDTEAEVREQDVAARGGASEGSSGRVRQPGDREESRRGRGRKRLTADEEELHGMKRAFVQALMMETADIVCGNAPGIKNILSRAIGFPRDFDLRDESSLTQRIIERMTTPSYLEKAVSLHHKLVGRGQQREWSPERRAFIDDMVRRKRQAGASREQADDWSSHPEVLIPGYYYLGDYCVTIRRERYFQECLRKGRTPGKPGEQEERALAAQKVFRDDPERFFRGVQFPENTASSRSVRPAPLAPAPKAVPNVYLGPRPGPPPGWPERRQGSRSARPGQHGPARSRPPAPPPPPRGRGAGSGWHDSQGPIPSPPVRNPPKSASPAQRDPRGGGASSSTGVGAGYVGQPSGGKTVHARPAKVWCKDIEDRIDSCMASNEPLPPFYPREPMDYEASRTYRYRSGERDTLITYLFYVLTRNEHVLKSDGLKKWAIAIGWRNSDRELWHSLFSLICRNLKSSFDRGLDIFQFSRFLCDSEMGGGATSTWLIERIIEGVQKGTNPDLPAYVTSRLAESCKDIPQFMDTVLSRLLIFLASAETKGKARSPPSSKAASSRESSPIRIAGGLLGPAKEKPKPSMAPSAQAASSGSSARKADDADLEAVPKVAKAARRGDKQGSKVMKSEAKAVNVKGRFPPPAAPKQGSGSRAHSESAPERDLLDRWNDPRGSSVPAKKEMAIQVVVPKSRPEAIAKVKTWAAELAAQSSAAAPQIQVPPASRSLARSALLARAASAKKGEGTDSEQLEPPPPPPSPAAKEIPAEEGGGERFTPVKRSPEEKESDKRIMRPPPETAAAALERSRRSAQGKRPVAAAKEAPSEESEAGGSTGRADPSSGRGVVKEELSDQPSRGREETRGVSGRAKAPRTAAYEAPAQPLPLKTLYYCTNIDCDAKITKAPEGFVCPSCGYTVGVTQVTAALPPQPEQTPQEEEEAEPQDEEEAEHDEEEKQEDESSSAYLSSRRSLRSGSRLDFPSSSSHSRARKGEVSRSPPTSRSRRGESPPRELTLREGPWANRPPSQLPRWNRRAGGGKGKGGRRPFQPRSKVEEPVHREAELEEAEEAEEADEKAEDAEEEAEPPAEKADLPERGVSPCSEPEMAEEVPGNSPPEDRGEGTFDPGDGSTGDEGNVWGDEVDYESGEVPHPPPGPPPTEEDEEAPEEEVPEDEERAKSESPLRRVFRPRLHTEMPEAPPEEDDGEEYGNGEEEEEYPVAVGASPPRNRRPRRRRGGSNWRSRGKGGKGGGKSKGKSNQDRPGHWRRGGGPSAEGSWDEESEQSWNRDVRRRWGNRDDEEGQGSIDSYRARDRHRHGGRRRNIIQQHWRSGHHSFALRALALAGTARLGAGCTTVGRPAHACARSLFGLKDPRLPSPYAQDASGYLAALVTVPPGASAAALAMWGSSSPLSALLAGLTSFTFWRSSTVIDDIATEATASAAVIMDTNAEEIIKTARQGWEGVRWLMYAVAVIAAVKILLWGSSELGPAWHNLWGYRDHRRPTPYAQDRAPPPIRRPAGLDEIRAEIAQVARPSLMGPPLAKGPPPGRVATPAAQLKAYPVPQQGVRTPPFKPPPAVAPVYSAQAKASALSAYDRVPYIFARDWGPLEQFIDMSRSLVGLKLRFRYPNGARGGQYRFVLVNGDSVGGDPVERMLQTYDYDVTYPRNYFFRAITDLIVEEIPGDHSAYEAAASALSRGRAITTFPTAPRVARREDPPPAARATPVAPVPKHPPQAATRSTSAATAHSASAGSVEASVEEEPEFSSPAQESGPREGAGVVAMLDPPTHLPAFPAIPITDLTAHGFVLTQLLPGVWAAGGQTLESLGAALLAAGWVPPGSPAVAQPALPLSGAAPAEPWPLKMLSDAGCQEEICRMIKDATVQVICSWFTLDDEEILRDLGEAATRNLDVRIVLDQGQEHAPSCSHQQERVIEAMRNRVRFAMATSSHGRRVLHQKSIVVDERECLLGSSNATTYSRRNNYEVAICTTDPRVVAPLKTKLETLWAQSSGEMTIDEAQRIMQLWLEKKSKKSRDRSSSAERQGSW